MHIICILKYSNFREAHAEFANSMRGGASQFGQMLEGAPRFCLCKTHYIIL